jgi:hypothetical protein
LKFFGDIARRYITLFLLLIATTPNTTLTWPRNQNGAEDFIHIKCVAHVREMVQKERMLHLNLASYLLEQLIIKWQDSSNKTLEV